MAKNFETAGNQSRIKEVARMSLEKANVITVKMIRDENLVDYPKNHEDCSNTADLENSMQELGFTDPIEVTTYDMDGGKYMIVSGHRRRAAGVKIGIEIFPCIIKNFMNESELRNYVLLSNCQRDSSKDPLLFCVRYKMHEEYLRENSFVGSVRAEIAKRLGFSAAQADRYNQFNQIILPIWEMVRAETVGMSSVLGMAALPESEQEEILKLLEERLESGAKLTREVCEDIIKNYREGGEKEEVIPEELPIYAEQKSYAATTYPAPNPTYPVKENKHCDNENDDDDNKKDEYLVGKGPYEKAEKFTEATVKSVPKSDGEEAYLLTAAARDSLMRTLPLLLEMLKESEPNDYVVLHCLLRKLEAEAVK